LVDNGAKEKKGPSKPGYTNINRLPRLLLEILYRIVLPIIFPSDDHGPECELVGERTIMQDLVVLHMYYAE